jgi:gamma-glutamylputrescine oxidase
VAEAQRAGFGASGRNGGQLGSGQRLGQRALEDLVGRDDARHLWRIAEAAKARTKTLAAQVAPDCDYQDGIVHADWQARNVPETHAAAAYMAEHYGYGQIEPLDKIGLQSLVNAPGYAGGAVDWGAGHLHPLRFALGLARAAEAAGARIFERTRVASIEEGTPLRIRTDQGQIRATHALLACNGYLGDLAPVVAAKVMPINNFMIATEPLADPASVLPQPVAVADSRFVVNYFRLSSDGRLLFGGGESYGYGFPKDIAALVRKPMQATFPQLKGVKIDYAWGGTLAITMSRLPLVTRISRHVLSASGYSGHGLALAAFMGEVTAKAIRGQCEEFDVMARLPVPDFPGGSKYRPPLLAAAMTWYGLRDKLGV